MATKHTPTLTSLLTGVPDPIEPEPGMTVELVTAKDYSTSLTPGDRGVVQSVDETVSLPYYVKFRSTTGGWRCALENSPQAKMLPRQPIIRVVAEKEEEVD